MKKSSSLIFQNKPQPQPYPQNKTYKKKETLQEKYVIEKPNKKQNSSPTTPCQVNSFFANDRITYEKPQKQPFTIIKMSSDSKPPVNPIAEPLVEKAKNEIPFKSIYTVEDLIALKPEKITEKLQTSGFISLCACTKPYQNGSTKKNKKNSDECVLNVHNDSRFIPSSTKNKVFEENKNSLEYKKAEAQRILNMLGTSNIKNSLNQILKLNLDNESFTKLFLDRATFPIENPEKNHQLSCLIDLTIQISNKDSFFYESIISKSYETAFQQLEDPDVHINSIQTMAVWLSALYNAKSNTDDKLYQFLDKACEVESTERAINILRCALYICGKNAEKDPKFNRFFDFLKNNKSKFGYTNYLVDSLFELQSNKWKLVNIESFFNSAGLNIQFKPTKITKKYDDIDDTENTLGFEIDYTKWSNEEEFEFTKYPPETIIRISHKLISEHFKDIDNFGQYCAEILANVTKDQEVVSKLLQRYFDIYAEDVQNEENSYLWVFYFVYIGALYDKFLISFELLQEFLLSSIKMNIKPVLKKVFSQMSNTVGIPIDDIITLRSNLGEPYTSDPEVFQSLVDLADIKDIKTEDHQNLLELSNQSMLHACVVFRYILDDALHNVDGKSLEILNSKTPIIAQLLEKYGKDLINIAEHVLAYYQPQNKNDIMSFIESNLPKG